MKRVKFDSQNEKDEHVFEDGQADDDHPKVSEPKPESNVSQSNTSDLLSNKAKAELRKFTLSKKAAKPTSMRTPTHRDWLKAGTTRTNSEPGAITSKSTKTTFPRQKATSKAKAQEQQAFGLKLA